MGRSVSCIVVRCPKMETWSSAGPKGITAMAMKAGIAAMIGART